MRQSIARALADEMAADTTVILMGEDVVDAEGPFKTSEGLLEQFGPLRVRDTPISEMGFCGAALGAAATGLRPVVEIMFVEFLGVALDMLATEAAKLRYLSGGAYTAPLVIPRQRRRRARVWNPALADTGDVDARMPRSPVGDAIRCRVGLLSAALGNPR